MAGLYRGKEQNDCPITYVQNKKYPTSKEVVVPDRNVSNKNLLKNPSNNLSEPIAKPGLRPLMITTDNLGNVFSRSLVDTVPGVTNNNLLKNPYNTLSEKAPERKVLSRQTIKDINTKALPDFIRNNRGITELAMKCLMMIGDPQVKLVTIGIMKFLVTKRSNHPELEKDRQKIQQSINIYEQLLSNARSVHKNVGNDDEQLVNALQPIVAQYEAQLKGLFPFLNGPVPADIQQQINSQLAELAVLSNSLTRLFEQNNSTESSSTLSTQKILGAGGVSGNIAPNLNVAPNQGGAPPNQSVVPPKSKTAKVTNGIVSWTSSKVAGGIKGVASGVAGGIKGVASGIKGVAFSVSEMPTVIRDAPYAIGALIQSNPITLYSNPALPFNLTGLGGADWSATMPKFDPADYPDLPPLEEEKKDIPLEILDPTRQSFIDKLSKTQNEIHRISISDSFNTILENHPDLGILYRTMFHELDGLIGSAKLPSNPLPDIRNIFKNIASAKQYANAVVAGNTPEIDTQKIQTFSLLQKPVNDFFFRGPPQVASGRRRPKSQAVSLGSYRTY